MELRTAIAGDFNEGKCMALFELTTSRICNVLIFNFPFKSGYIFWFVLR
jgi:hypothetical protein